MTEYEERLASALGDDTAERLVASFVPELLRSEIESLTLSEECDRFTSFITKPYSRTFTAVCMIIDIVGFVTVMSQHIARQDVYGITKKVKFLVAKIVNLVYNASGDVIEFVGSSIVCLFQPADQTSNSYRKACIHAMTCAWELKDLSTTDLGVRVGISYGELTMGLLGGFTNCWRFVVTGSCKKDMMSSLQEASIAQVLVTRKCHLLLSGSEQVDVDSTTPFDYGAIEFQPSNPELFLVTIYKSKRRSSTKAVDHFRFRTLIFSSGSHESTTSHAVSPANSVEFISQVYSFVPLPVTRAVIVGSFETISEVANVTVLFIRMNEYEGMDFLTLSHIAHINTL